MIVSEFEIHSEHSRNKNGAGLVRELKYMLIKTSSIPNLQTAVYEISIVSIVNMRDQ